MFQLTFNPGLTLTAFWTTRHRKEIRDAISKISKKCKQTAKPGFSSARKKKFYNPWNREINVSRKIHVNKVHSGIILSLIKISDKNK